MKEQEQQFAITFANDMDFTTNGEDCKEKMQVIIEKYTSLYKAIGGFIQYEKISYYCWNWQRKNGIL